MPIADANANDKKYWMTRRDDTKQADLWTSPDLLSRFRFVRGFCQECFLCVCPSNIRWP